MTAESNIRTEQLQTKKQKTKQNKQNHLQRGFYLWETMDPEFSNSTQLKAVTLNYAPFVFGCDGNSANLTAFEHFCGTCFDILRKLEKDLNISFEIVKMETQFGMSSKNADGEETWSGLIGDLQKKGRA